MTYDQVIGNLIDTNILVVENSNNRGSYATAGCWPVVPISVTAIYTSKVFPEITLEIILTYNISFVGYNYNNTAINNVTTANVGFPCMGTLVPAVTEQYTALVSDTSDTVEDDCDEEESEPEPTTPPGSGPATPPGSGPATPPVH